MKPSEEQIGVAAPVDRIVRGGNVADAGKYVLDELQHSDGNGEVFVNSKLLKFWQVS